MHFIAFTQGAGNGCFRVPGWLQSLLKGHLTRLCAESNELQFRLPHWPRKLARSRTRMQKKTGHAPQVFLSVKSTSAPSSLASLASGANKSLTKAAFASACTALKGTYERIYGEEDSHHVDKNTCSSVILHQSGDRIQSSALFCFLGYCISVRSITVRLLCTRLHVMRVNFGEANDLAACPRIGAVVLLFHKKSKACCTVLQSVWVLHSFAFSWFYHKMVYL